MTMIYFLHPDIKIRAEEFGGVIQTATGIHVLDEAEYAFISSFREMETDDPDELLQKFFSMGAICSISPGEASSLR